MIQKIRVVGGIAVVTATAEFHPLRQLKQLATELEAIGFKGSVLFDLLAVNGLAENRFASINFTGKQFDRNSFAVESDVNQNIKSEQDSFARNDETFLLGSVLSSSEVEKFTH
ncbi:MAG: type II toxin-antitoxin system RnlB family antitoxin [Gammaproteobacteria bacterium]|uniref:type II toxin-antitoxin system RnlB family antitoxin n=1 Tax=Shewanella algae TaxID=38313 RepID=UPI0016A60FA3|nr:type II toxin-antitoxin system RnlB family antitoxin [Shewanella algae]NLY16306.1 type II toxin-antitoxin system RnlB family antitoxin [Gammaproteobacteria bacterium]